MCVFKKKKIYTEANLSLLRLFVTQVYLMLVSDVHDILFSLVNEGNEKKKEVCGIGAMGEGEMMRT